MMSHEKSLLLRVFALLGLIGYLCLSLLSARRRQGVSQTNVKSPSATDDSNGTPKTSNLPPDPPNVPKKRQRANMFEAALLGERWNPEPRPPKPKGPGLWKWFRQDDSPASVVFGCAAFLTTAVLIFATIVLAIRANNLLDQQNALMRASSQPDVSASLISSGDGGFTLTVENSGPRANFRSIQPMTFLRFTFQNYQSGIEHGYVALYDVFSEIEPNRAGTGQLGTITSVSGLTARTDELCSLIRTVDDRIQECALDIALVIRYQTNTDDVFTSYYRFDGEVSYLVSAGELERQTSRWDDNPNDRTGFPVAASPPDGMVGWVNEYIDQRADEPDLLLPLD